MVKWKIVIVIKKRNPSRIGVQTIYMAGGMNQPLPYGGFDRLNKQEIKELDLDSVSENSSIGYFLEVDLKYPSDFHDSHNDYPLAPEKLEISSDMLSKYCSDIADKCGIKVGGVSKLVPNLRHKKIHSSSQKSSVVFVIRNEVK